MPIKWRTNRPTTPPATAQPPPTNRGVSAVLLDFVFGEPVPQPEVTEHDSDQAWQDWLDAKARQDAMKEFQDTEPMAADGPGPTRPN